MPFSPRHAGPRIRSGLYSDNIRVLPLSGQGREGRDWVRLGKAQTEQLSSALP
jgi:hypothetical protein